MKIILSGSLLIICCFTYVSILLADEINHAPDSVEIKGKYYQIKPPWLGHKIGHKTDSIPANLKMLPREYGRDSSRIFVTNETRDAFLTMIQQAERDDISFKVTSGFRSYGYQTEIFSRRMDKGRTFDKVSKNVAPPGYSEHMLGTALDLVTDTVPFAHSIAYEWLKSNAGKFGFVESYPKDSKDGFSWEAWHWRYVGDTLK